ncbi:Thioesterase-like superfamily protein [Parafrankia irregularis]|uniref:Thioesterase-like superfamily protein n=1 Tax=Parafrankia irregularis TaxID=795642 RepID=A0A0S4QM10_9ACTN|nr:MULTISPECIES: acyl-CoA thioesterase domain-containing protein [Parafrankia]MBE3200099.1 thioesterase family protein [Parafrankia sp. CH37]CUU56715.1 Thioesterase-like superfamily protein [Parafrankia irregularis]
MSDPGGGQPAMLADQASAGDPGSDGGPSSAYFRRLDDGRYQPGRFASGIWASGSVSGRILGGLIGHVLVQEQAEPGYQLARLTVDMFRSIPYAPLQVSTSLVRAGGRIRVADVHVSHDGVVVTRATAVFLRPSSNAPGEIWHAEREVWPAPRLGSPVPQQPEGSRADVRPMVRGDESGGAVVPTAGVQRGGSWLREVREVVEGTPLTPLARAILVADMTSPLTHRGTGGLQYINTDFTLTLVREPVGEFFGVLAQDQYAVDGVSFGLTTIHDAAGLLGTCTTTALANAGRADPAHLLDRRRST